MNKKVLIIGHAYILPVNRRVWSYLAQDVDVDLIVPLTWKSNLAGIIDYDQVEDDSCFQNIYPLKTYFKGNGSFYFFKLIQFYKILKKNKYDLVLINQESWSLSLFFLTLFFKLLKLDPQKFVVVAQNLKKKKLRFLIPFEKFNLSGRTKVLGCCSETEDVLRWKGIQTDWEYQPLYYNEKTVKYVERYLKRDQKNITLGYLGRLSEEKGIDLLLDAFEALKLKHSIKLVLAGSGPLEHKLKNISGLEYMGVLGHENVQDFYDKIDLFILPSLTKGFWKEQFGRVLVESVMSGVMVAGSNSGAIPEVLGHMDIDYIFEENSVDSIIKVVEHFIDDLSKNKVSIKTETSRELCIQKFSENSYSKRVIKYASF